jgi:hypothetical protein
MRVRPIRLTLQATKFSTALALLGCGFHPVVRGPKERERVCVWEGGPYVKHISPIRLSVMSWCSDYVDVLIIRMIRVSGLHKHEIRD